MQIIATTRPPASPGWLPRRPPAGVRPADGGRGLVDWMLVAGMLAMFCVSGYGLEFFGIPYVSAGGFIGFKLHPSLYMFCLALMVAVLAHPDPIGYGGGLIARRMGAVALILASAFVFAVMFRLKPDLFAASLVDSIAAAGVIALLLADASPRVRFVLARIVHVVVAVNCALAIVEVATGWRLFPFGVKGMTLDWDYRATALFGHPLDGALAVGVYAVILMTARNVLGLSERLRVPLVLLAMASMPAIGGRTAFAVVFAVAGVVAGLQVLRFMLGGRVRPGVLMLAAVGVPLAVAGVFAAFQAGVFDDFLGRFQSDSGSASARFELFDLFRGFGLGEWLMGFDIGELKTQVRVFGLEAGIENAWVAHVLLYGLPLSLILWGALAAFLWEVLRECGRAAILPVLFVLLINTASVGISGKTTMLVLPVSIILILQGGIFAPAPFRIRRPT